VTGVAERKHAREARVMPALLMRMLVFRPIGSAINDKFL
jgi:hypothetical protein